MDLFAELVLVIGVSVAAHVSIAWTAIAYHARKAERKWRGLVTTEMIPNAAREASETILPQLRAELPAAVKAALTEVELPTADLEPFLRSPAGVAWAQELGTYVTSSLKQELASRAGVVAHQASSAAEKLLNGAITFDNPMIDGLWAMVPLDTKRMVARKLAAVYRKAAFEGFGDGETDRLAEPAPTIQQVGTYLL